MTLFTSTQPWPYSHMHNIDLSHIHTTLTLLTSHNLDITHIHTTFTLLTHTTLTLLTSYNLDLTHINTILTLLTSTQSWLYSYPHNLDITHIYTTVTFLTYTYLWLYSHPHNLDLTHVCTLTQLDLTVICIALIILICILSLSLLTSIYWQHHPLPQFLYINLFWQFPNGIWISSSNLLYLWSHNQVPNRAITNIQGGKLHILSKWM